MKTYEFACVSLNENDSDITVFGPVLAGVHAFWIVINQEMVVRGGWMDPLKRV